MRMKTLTSYPLGTSTTFAAFLLGVILLCEFPCYSIASSTAIYTSSLSTLYPRHYNSRVKRQLFREQIPHHRPLSGNIYAEHHGFPHPGRWHPNPQGILPPNPNSGHHFDDPNVILTDDDFNLYGSTLQHLDNLNHYQSGGGAPALALPIQHPPALPQAFSYGQGQGQGHGAPVHVQAYQHPPPRKRRPVKILVHHQVHPTVHTKPIVHSYPVEYGKLIPIEGSGAVEGPGLDGPVLPIIAAHHHQNLINNNNLHESHPGGPPLSFAQEYKNIAHDHDQKAGLPLLKVKSLFHRLKLPHGFGNKFSNLGQIPILKSVFPIRYGAHDDRGKNGAFSWSVAY